MALGGMLKNLGGGRSAVALRASPRGAGAGQSAIESADRLAMLDAFEQAEIGWLWATDPEGRLLYLSASAMSKFGDGVQVIGEHLGKLLETVSEDEEHAGRPVSFLLGARNRFADHPVRVTSSAGEMFWALT